MSVKIGLFEAHLMEIGWVPFKYLEDISVNNINDSKSMKANKYLILSYVSHFLSIA